MDSLPQRDGWQFCSVISSDSDPRNPIELITFGQMTWGGRWDGDGMGWRWDGDGMGNIINLINLINRSQADEAEGRGKGGGCPKWTIKKK